MGSPIFTPTFGTKAISSRCITRHSKTIQTALRGFKAHVDFVVAFGTTERAETTAY